MKIVAVSDFRIDFAAITALIVRLQHRSHYAMPADLKESAPTPLAEIAQGPSAFELFLDRNQKNLVILSILIALAVAVWVVISGIKTSQQETAGAALNAAQDLPALQAVVTEHAGTKAASSAMLLLADHQWTEGQQDSAIETLKKFIAANPEHPALPSAQASLGAKFMLQGKTADATKTFEEIVANPEARFIAPYALISLGDLAQLGGDLKLAESHYSKVTLEYPESRFVQTANLRLATLKTKAPIEIAPPPPAATTPASPTPGAPALTPPAPAPTPAPAPAPAPKESPAPEKTTPPAP